MSIEPIITVSGPTPDNVIHTSIRFPYAYERITITFDLRGLDESFQSGKQVKKDWLKNGF